MPDLIIFDCDGTLVDTEMLYNTITSELLTALGLPEYTPMRCVELFAGQSWWTIKRTLEDKHGTEIPEALVQDFVAQSHARMVDIEATEGAVDVVSRLSETHDICVASNGERNGVLKSLATVGLAAYFPETHVFTKIQVERPKPAPDLFLFTAAEMGFERDACLVVEDSAAGVAAAVAADMRVIGYTGAAHDTARQADLLRDAGAVEITDCLKDVIKHI